MLILYLLDISNNVSNANVLSNGQLTILWKYFVIKIYTMRLFSMEVKHCWLEFIDELIHIHWEMTHVITVSELDICEPLIDHNTIQLYFSSAIHW
jgi:hypothetical protein